MKQINFKFPILKNDGTEFKDVDEISTLLGQETTGQFLLGSCNHWHGGIHITDKTAPWCKDIRPVRAIADGRVVAYRISKDYTKAIFKDKNGKEHELKYSNNFCLIEHDYYQIDPESQQSKKLTFYSLYMHLQPWERAPFKGVLFAKNAQVTQIDTLASAPVKGQNEIAGTAFAKDALLEIVSDITTITDKNSNGREINKCYTEAKLRCTLKSTNKNPAIRAASGINYQENTTKSWIKIDPLWQFTPPPPYWACSSITVKTLTGLSARTEPVDEPNGNSVAGETLTNIKIKEDQQITFKPHTRSKVSYPSKRNRFVASSTVGEQEYWFCIDDEFCKITEITPPELFDDICVPEPPIPVWAGDTVGFLGLTETPTSFDGKKNTKYQVHLEVFTSESSIEDILASKLCQGVSKIDAADSDGYLDKDAPSAFFTALFNKIKPQNTGNAATDANAENIGTALHDKKNVNNLRQLAVKHTSEWYSLDDSWFYQFLQRLPENCAHLVEYEKKRIENLVWMNKVHDLSGKTLMAEKALWHFHPLLLAGKPRDMSAQPNSNSSKGG